MQTAAGQHAHGLEERGFLHRGHGVRAPPFLTVRAWSHCLRPVADCRLVPYRGKETGHEGHSTSEESFSGAVVGIPRPVSNRCTNVIAVLKELGAVKNQERVRVENTFQSSLDSFSFESRLAFLKKRAHSFVLVFGREAERKQVNFTAQALIEI